jgi:alpha-ketoglutarate-dependent taurine dioxygenase
MRTQFVTNPLSSHTGCVVTANAQAALEEIPAHLIQEHVASSGAVLLRGFQVERASFAEFTSRFSALEICHRSSLRIPVSSGSTTQTVLAAPVELPLHGELYFIPPYRHRFGRPDLLWFYCESPGDEGGETLICDGLLAWRSLPPCLLTLFTNHMIRYRHTTPYEIWTSVANTPADCLSQLARVPGVNVAGIDSCGVLSWDYATFAHVSSRYQRLPAFVNSLLTISDAYTVFLETDTPFDSVLSATLRDTLAAHTVPLRWQTGDVFVLDNTRFLHGRRTPSVGRSILTRMSLANF